MERFTRRRLAALAGLAGSSVALGAVPGGGSANASERERPRRMRQHVVIGGDGPPLLLVHGWPETWFAWR